MSVHVVDNVLYLLLEWGVDCRSMLLHLILITHRTPIHTPPSLLLAPSLTPLRKLSHNSDAAYNVNDGCA